MISVLRIEKDLLITNVQFSTINKYSNDKNEGTEIETKVRHAQNNYVKKRSSNLNARERVIKCLLSTLWGHYIYIQD